MKRKLFVILFTLFLFLPLSVFADSKVKVYIFEAGGCTFCEKQQTYLKGLDGYNKTFEVVTKELYVDHIKWEHGKDYDLGVKTAKVFKEAGFNNASYNSTPFVVISDLYASSSYNSNLESVINEAYKKGDKDIVSCIDKDQNGGYSCLNLSEDDTEEDNIDEKVEEDSNPGFTVTFGSLTSDDTSYLNKNKCLFGRDVCCDTLFEISVCYWLLGVALVILLIILIGLIKRRKKNN